jgi:hypothetical protein
LCVWDIESGESIVVYQAKSYPLSVIMRLAGSLIYGDGAGQVVFLRSSNLHMKPLLLTPVRLFLHKRKEKDTSWDNEVTATCTWCGQRFALDQSIENLKNKFPPNCPLCNKPIRFNPFIVDNRGLYSLHETSKLVRALWQRIYSLTKRGRA